MNKGFILLICILLATGCIWEDEESLFPEEGVCDTSNVSYQEDVLPIMSANCYACHSNVNAPDFASGIALEEYEDVFASTDLIIGAINHSDGFPAMPKGEEKLDSCSILTLEAWILQGALEN